MPPVVVLLLPALFAAPEVARFALHAAAQMMHPATGAILGQAMQIAPADAAVRPGAVHPGQVPWWLAWSSVAAALLVADYVTWLVVGLALFSATFAFAP